MQKPVLSSKRFKHYLLEYNTLVIFVLMVVVSSLISDVFLTTTNLSNLLRQVSGIGILSMGMLLVILTGGIDLSVGSMMAMSSVFASFIASLAMMTIARGLGFIFSKGSPVILDDQGAALTSFGNGYLLGIPNPVLVMFLVFIVVFVLLRYTVFGRLTIAIGSNEEAVRLSGIRTRNYKWLVYAISGGCGALAGIISTSRTGVGSPIIGVGLELDVIAAVVIGGASLNGGKGKALNTLLGVLILGMIGNIMNLLNVPAYPQQVIKGLIIILAVLLQGIQSRLNEK
jgi:ribose transport system permease protein